MSQNSGNQSSRRREVTKEISSALSSVSPNVIREVLKALKYPAIGTKPAMIQIIEDVIMKHGIHLLLSKFKKMTIKQIALLLDCEPKQRAIQDIIVKHGLPAFLQQKCDVKLLQECCQMLGLDAGASFDASSKAEKGSEDLEREVADEVMLMGTDEMLRSLPLSVLVEVARDLGLLPPITDPTAPPPSYSHLTVIGVVDRIMDKVFDLVPLEQYLAATGHSAAHSGAGHSSNATFSAVSSSSPTHPPPAKRAKIDVSNTPSRAADNNANALELVDPLAGDTNAAASSSAAAFISQNAARIRSKKSQKPKQPKASASNAGDMAVDAPILDSPAPLKTPKPKKSSTKRPSVGGSPTKLPQVPPPTTPTLAASPASAPGPAASSAAPATSTTPTPKKKKKKAAPAPAPASAPAPITASTFAPAPTEDKMDVDPIPAVETPQSTPAKSAPATPVSKLPDAPPFSVSTKPPGDLTQIKPGIMVSHLHKFFSVADLHRYLHQEGIDSSQIKKKQQLAKRIMAHLETKVKTEPTSSAEAQAPSK